MLKSEVIRDGFTFLLVNTSSVDVYKRQVIDFNKQIVKLEKGNKPVRIEFKKVVNEAKVTRIKMLHKQIDDGEIENKINCLLYTSRCE